MEGLLPVKGETTIDDVASRFVAMSESEKRLFLTVYAHDLTVLARMYFLDSDHERAWKCNETIHKILGYLSSGWLNPKKELDAMSFIGMLVRSASQDGWSYDLIRALQSTINASYPAS